MYVTVLLYASLSIQAGTAQEVGRGGVIHSQS